MNEVTVVLTVFFGWLALSFVVGPAIGAFIRGRK